jgi:hypothetical protein
VFKAPVAVHTPPFRTSATAESAATKPPKQMAVVAFPTDANLDLAVLRPLEDDQALLKTTGVEYELTVVAVFVVNLLGVAEKLLSNGATIGQRSLAFAIDYLLIVLVPNRLLHYNK